MSFMGTRYSGWQRQIPGIPSIQEEVEKALLKATGMHVDIIGCGRTDAGVHARQFFAHCDLETIPDLKVINFILPNDIVVHDAIRVDDKSHARYDAILRTYEYHIHTKQNPFLHELSFFYKDREINTDLINDACQQIMQCRDFRSFCKTPDRHKTTICHISRCDWSYNSEKGTHLFTISANRFLKSMIRIMLNELLNLSAGVISKDEFNYLLQGKRINQVHKIAFPQGLYLSEIKYPYFNSEPQALF